MADDDHYLEARPEYTAGGRLMAAIEADRCSSTYIAGYSQAFRCALPEGHDDTHESEGGSGWAEPRGMDAITSEEYLRMSEEAFAEPRQESADRVSGVRQIDSEPTERGSDDA